jgi:hypothetical protein
LATRALASCAEHGSYRGTAAVSGAIVHHGRKRSAVLDDLTFERTKEAQSSWGRTFGRCCECRRPVLVNALLPAFAECCDDSELSILRRTALKATVAGRSMVRYSKHRFLRGARLGRADKSNGFAGFLERPMATGPRFSSYRSGRGLGYGSRHFIFRCDNNALPRIATVPITYLSN